jgi:cytochrome c556
VICAANAGWTTNQALAWLKQAGTSTDYSGLYRSVREFRPIDSAVVAGIRELPEIAPTSPLVESMAAIGDAFDRLKFAEKSAWSKMPPHDNTTPAEAATVLWEHFRELARAEDTATRTDDYRAKLASSEKHSNQLRALLRAPGSDAKLRDEAFRSLGQSCKACHVKYRD